MSVFICPPEWENELATDDTACAINLQMQPSEYKKQNVELSKRPNETYLFVSPNDGRAIRILCEQTSYSFSLSKIRETEACSSNELAHSIALYGSTIADASLGDGKVETVIYSQQTVTATSCEPIH